MKLQYLHELERISGPMELIDDGYNIGEAEYLELIRDNIPKDHLLVFLVVDSVDEYPFNLAKEHLFLSVAEAHTEKTRFLKEGILVIYSDNPKLIQIASGRRMKNAAAKIELNHGSKYLDLQKSIPRLSVYQGVLDAKMHVVNALEKYYEFSWFHRLILRVQLDTFINGAWLVEMSFSDPSSNQVGRGLINGLVLFDELLHSHISSKGLVLIQYLLLLSIVFYLFKKVLIGVVSGLLRLIFDLSVLWSKIIAVIFAVVSIAYLSMPVFGFATLLSGSRVEDSITVEQLEISGYETMAASANDIISLLLSEHLLFLLLYIFVAVSISACFGKIGVYTFRAAKLPELQQRETYNKMISRPEGEFYIQVIVQGSHTEFIDVSSTAPFDDLRIRMVFVALFAGLKWSLLTWLLAPIAVVLLVAVYFTPNLIVGVFRSIFLSSRKL